jgi:hypothetical protein
MEMEMGGGALALCLVDFGPEGVGVGEKSARVVRRATLTDVAAMAYPVVASLSNAVTCSRQR